MIDGKTALVTGSTRGIGRAIALALAKEGFAVAVNGRSNPGDILAEVEKSGSPAIFCKGDISSAKDRAGILKKVEKEFGRLDLLVNNAGAAPEERLDILEATEESFDKTLAINLKGPWFLTRDASKWMIELKRKNRELQPAIVNISSISAYTSSTNRGEYCVAKAGIAMMTKLFAHRLADKGVRVYEIRPGIIDTDMTAGARDLYDSLIASGMTPIMRWGRPEDVAQAVRAVALELLPFSTGEVINVDGGFHLHRL